MCVISALSIRPPCGCSFFSIPASLDKRQTVAYRIAYMFDEQTMLPVCRERRPRWKQCGLPLPHTYNIWRLARSENAPLDKPTRPFQPMSLSKCDTIKHRSRINSKVVSNGLGHNMDVYNGAERCLLLVVVTLIFSFVVQCSIDLALRCTANSCPGVCSPCHRP